jgi:tetratricopeptide (TPR) repeat protein
MTYDSLDKKYELAEQLATTPLYDEAEKLLLAILADMPNHRRALNLLGYVLFFMGRFEEGETVCRANLRHYPDDAYAMKGLGLHVAKQGRLIEGLESIRRAIDQKPSWYDPYWDFLVICTENGRPDLAQEVWQMALARFPQARNELNRLMRGAP